MRSVHRITCFWPSRADSVFITCASYEERCLGVPRRFSGDYRFDNAFVFAYDHPSEERERHLEEMKSILTQRGNVQRILTSEEDPIVGIRELVGRINELGLDPESAIINIDATTFTKRHLLLLLKALDEGGLWPSLRVYYTEPRDYITDLYLPMSTGIRTISPVTGFVGHSPLSKPTLLVAFLGYEGDRARAIYENLDPNEVLLVVPKPAYHPEWEGRTEQMNEDIIKIVGQDRVRYAHSQNSSRVEGQLKEMLDDYPLEEWRCCIAPLGGKPQALGIYRFWRQNPGSFSVIYAQPLKRNERFFSTGVEKTWLLLTPTKE